MKIVLETRRLTGRRVADVVGISSGAFQAILTTVLGIRRLIVEFDPKFSVTRRNIV